MTLKLPLLRNNRKNVQVFSYDIFYYKICLQYNFIYILYIIEVGRNLSLNLLIVEFHKIL